jgi:hypothetical protein
MAWVTPDSSLCAGVETLLAAGAAGLVSHNTGDRLYLLFFKFIYDPFNSLRVSRDHLTAMNAVGVASYS